MLDPKDVLEIVAANTKRLAFNQQLMDIYEGELGKYVRMDLAKEMRPETYKQIITRLAPINILPKVVDKLTNIYQTTVTRTTDDANTDLMSWFVNEMDMDAQMNAANELFNLNQSCLIQPNVFEGKPYICSIPPSKFIPVCTNMMSPNTPTDIILLYKYGNKDVYWVYSDETIYAMDSEKTILKELMLKYGFSDLTNPIERLPFIYLNASKHNLIPKCDEDGLKMIKLLPIMLSDLNYAAMFQSFSIIYGVNVDEENLAMAPNAFWRFKSDLTNDQKPEIGVIKPQVDFDQVLNLIQSQLQMWLGTKGIRASSVGGLKDGDNFASGISKIIDEMDTYEAREKQVNIFTKGESEFWELLRVMQNYWVSTKQIENTKKFTEAFEVSTKFTTQLPMQTRGQVVRDLRDEVAAGFTSQSRAIGSLNPEMSQKDIEQLMKEIQNERIVEVDYGVAENQLGYTEGTQAGAT